MKYLNFTIAETSGRTFEIPLDKVKSFIEKVQAEDFFMAQEEVDFEDSYSMAQFLNNNGLLDELHSYERCNDTFESEVVEHKIYEGEE